MVLDDFKFFIVNNDYYQPIDSNGSIDPKISLNLCISKTRLYVKELIKNSEILGNIKLTLEIVYTFRNDRSRNREVRKR